MSANEQQYDHTNLDNIQVALRLFPRSLTSNDIRVIYVDTLPSEKIGALKESMPVGSEVVVKYKKKPSRGYQVESHSWAFEQPAEGGPLRAMYFINLIG